MKRSSVLRLFVVLGVLWGCLVIATGVGVFLCCRGALYRSEDILVSMTLVIIPVACIVIGFILPVWSFKYFNVPFDWEGNISRDKEEQRRINRGAQIIIATLVTCLIQYIQVTRHSHLPYEVSLFDSCMSENKKRVNLPSGIRVDRKVSQQRDQIEKAADLSFCAFRATMNSNPWKSKFFECWEGISDSSINDSSPEVISCLQETMLDARELLAEKRLVNNFEKIDRHINNTGGYDVLYNYIKQ